MAEVGSTNAQSEAELRVKQKARRHMVEARAAQSMGEALVHGAEFVQQLRAEVGGTWLDDGRVWRLVSVSTHHLDTFEEGELRGETHVVGVYVDHVKYPNSDACPPSELEWSKAEEVLGWIRGTVEREDGHSTAGPGGPT